MKVIYLHQYFNTPEMNGGTRSYEFARRLVGKGHDVHMVTSWREASEEVSWYTENIKGINVHWLPVLYSNNMSYIQRIVAFFHFALKASLKARSLNGDVVLATSTPLTIAIPGVIAARRMKVPMVFEVRDLWPELPIAMKALKNPLSRYFARALERFAYRNSSEIIALSPDMKEGVIKTGFPENRVTVIPNSCDEQFLDVKSEEVMRFRNKRDWLGDRPLVIYAGTFGMINGVSYLVDLARETARQNPNIRFLLIGEGFEKEMVRDYADQQGVLNNNLFIENGVAKEMMPVVYAAADIACSTFVDLPEMWANSANKFFDSMASGTPILINYAGWQADFLRSNDIGLITHGLPIKDAASLVVDFLSSRDKIVTCRKTLEAGKVFSRSLLFNEFEKTLLKAIS